MNTEIFNEITNKVSKTLFKKYGCLTNTCDLASEMVAKELSNKNIHGYIAFGIYKTEFEDVDHRWIVVDGYYVDASRNQFDEDEKSEMFFKIDDNLNYEEIDYISEF